MKLVTKFRNKHFILLDCDGVVWKGNHAIKDAQNVLEKLEQAGIKLGFVTNNSSLSREGFIQKFRVLGFNPDEYIVVNSAYGASVYLRERNYSRIFMIGESGLKEELELQDIYIAEKYEAKLEGVCIGWDRQLSWQKLADAMRVIINDNGLFLVGSYGDIDLLNVIIAGHATGITAQGSTSATVRGVLWYGNGNKFSGDVYVSDNYYDGIINLKRINDIRYINKFFEGINIKLPMGGKLVGCAETKNLRKERILRKLHLHHPPWQ